MSARTTTQAILDKVSMQRQLEAAHLMLDGALLTGSAADVRHLRQHAHNLLDKVMDLQAEVMDILKASMT